MMKMIGMIGNYVPLVRPVTTPPCVFFNLGIPSANNPPIPGSRPVLTISLLRFVELPPPLDMNEPFRFKLLFLFPLTIGALRSFVTAFLNFFPC